MKSKKKIEVFPIVNGLIFIILSLLIIIPMWKVLVDSFDLKTAYGMKLWPEEFGLAGYISVFKNPTLSHPLMISVITTIAGTIIALILSTFGAYVLIQWDMPGRNHDFSGWYDPYLPRIKIITFNQYHLGRYLIPGTERV